MGQRGVRHMGEMAVWVENETCSLTSCASCARSCGGFGGCFHFGGIKSCDMARTGFGIWEKWVMLQNMSLGGGLMGVSDWGGGIGGV